MQEALFTVGGALIGIALSALFRAVTEHRRWVRDARLSAYLEFLDAFDNAHAAAASYMHVVYSLAKQGPDADVGVMNRIQRRLYEDWRSASETDGVMLKTAAKVELVGSGPVTKAVTMARASLQMLTPVHLFDYDPVVAEGAYEEWDERSESRLGARRRFVSRAKSDLRTGVGRWTLSDSRARARAWWRRRRLSRTER